jgi:hypothetical protein
VGRTAEPPLAGRQEGLDSYVKDITQERLRDEWLLWNRSLDEARGWDTGILHGVEMEEGGREEEVVPPSVKPEITLHASLQRAGVGLTWEVQKGQVGEFILLRAADGDPEYPRDVLARLPGSSTAYLDSEVEKGKSYTSRVAVEHEGAVVMSNAVKVGLPAAPSPTVSLAAVVVDGGGGIPVVRLTWHAEGSLTADYFLLVRARGEAEPTYPPGENMPSWRFDPSGSDYAYVDRDVYTGFAYRYRVYAVKDGRAVLASNAATVYVETSSLY